MPLTLQAFLDAMASEPPDAPPAPFFQKLFREQLPDSQRHGRWFYDFLAGVWRDSAKVPHPVWIFRLILCGLEEFLLKRVYQEALAQAAESICMRSDELMTVHPVDSPAVSEFLAGMENVFAWAMSPSILQSIDEEGTPTAVRHAAFRPGGVQDAYFFPDFALIKSRGEDGARGLGHRWIDARLKDLSAYCDENDQFGAKSLLYVVIGCLSITPKKCKGRAHWLFVEAALSKLLACGVRSRLWRRS